MEGPPRIPDVPPHAPPTRPTAPVPAARSTWPMVIGVLMCVFGGVGLLQRVLGVVFTALMPVLPLPPEMTITGTLWTFTVVLSIIGLPLSVVHLMAGIQTIRRKPSARRWVVIFFAYAVVLLPPSAVLQYMSTQHQMQQASQQGGSSPGMAAFGQGFALIIAILTVVVALLWPTFLLVWYSRATIREEIASWAPTDA